MSLADNHIQVFHFKHDLKIIVSTFLLEFESSIGGCRQMSYTMPQDAILDCYNLSQAMAVKSFFQELPFGGGKCVIYNPSNLPFGKIAPYLGDILSKFNGSYYTSMDIGTSANEIECLSQYSKFLYGTHSHDDPSIYTAHGVNACIAKLAIKLNKDPADIIINIQGLGKVGKLVAKYCLDQGYRVNAYDIDTATKHIFDDQILFKFLTDIDIVTAPSDIFVPAAGGNVINDQNVTRLNCNYVCSVANNPLYNPIVLGDYLADKGITYIPDFLTNAGGVVFVANKLLNPEYTWHHSESIGQRVEAFINKHTGKNLFKCAIEAFNQRYHIES